MATRVGLRDGSHDRFPRPQRMLRLPAGVDQLAFELRKIVKFAIWGMKKVDTSLKWILLTYGAA